MSNIRLQIKAREQWDDVPLPAGSKITIEELSPLWNDETSGAFSYPFTIDIDENLSLFGTTAEIHGESVVKLLDRKPFRLFVRGNMWKTGIIRMDESVNISHNSETGHREVEISLESERKSMDELLNGVRVRDLDLLQYKIQIGYCLPDELQFSGSYTKVVEGWSTPAEAEALGDTLIPRSSETIEYTKSITIPKMLVVDYHDGIYNGQYTANFCNVQNPYNPVLPLQNPYCNARAAYQKYKWDSSTKKWEEERGMNMGEPERVNSAPCFYFGFVHDELFRQLGIDVTSNALNNLLDYCRLAFWNTKPVYKTEEVEGAEFDRNNDANRVKIDVSYRSGRQYRGYYSHADYNMDWVHRYTLERSITADYQLCRAYATADNLPDIEANDIVDATKNAFGAKYLYDPENGTLKIVLVRDVLSDPTTYSIGSLSVIGAAKKGENNIRGVRLKYSASNEMSKNTITKKENIVEGSDETTYNYNDYRYPYVIGGGWATYDGNGSVTTDYRDDIHVDSYSDLIQSVTDYDLRLYIDPNTSNAYRIKVNGDAETQSEWFPSLFQVAAFRDVTIGDVSDDNYVTEISIPFSPAVPTDTNFEKEYRAAVASGEVAEGDESEETEDSEETPMPIYGQFVNGEIHRHADSALIHRRYVHNAIPLAYLVDQSTGKNNICCHIDLDLDIRAVEDYEVSNSSDGAYFDNEPEFVLGIMRGSGTNAQIVTYEDDYDGEGHSLFMETNGTEAEFTSDTMDVYGNMYDYNGGGITEVDPKMAKSYIISNYPRTNVLLTPKKYLDESLPHGDNYAVKMQYNDVMLAIGTITISTENGSITKFALYNMFGNRFKYSTIPYVVDLETHDTYHDEDDVEALYTVLHSYDQSVLADYGTNGGGSADSIMAYDSQNKNMLVGIYDSYQEATAAYSLLNDLGDAYVGYDSEVNFPENGLGYEFKDLISLRLKSEIPIDGEPSKGYYPVNNPLARNRGLADKFWGAYFHWLLNHKVATLPVLMNAEDMRDIDWFKRYNIGNIVGYINKKTYTISDDSVENMEIEMFYL